MSFATGHVLAAAESSAPSPLRLPLDELIIGLIAFAVVLLLLGRIALPAIKRTLDERADRIEGGMARADAAQAEAQELLDRYREQMAGAQAEASQIRTEAQAERSSILDAARQDAQREQAVIAERTQASLLADRSQAKAELSREVGRLAYDLAAKVVGESLTDDARAKAVVDRFIAELEAAGDSQAAGTGQA
jgi:F-type H+-transporting ATPase subunit b